MRIANAVTVVIAAPIPWTALKTMRAKSEGASPPRKEAIVKMMSPP